MAAADPAPDIQMSDHEDDEEVVDNSVIIHGKHTNFDSVRSFDPCLECIKWSINHFDATENKKFTISCMFVPGVTRCQRCTRPNINTSCSSVPGLMVGDFRDFRRLAAWVNSKVLGATFSDEEGGPYWYYSDAFRQVALNGLRNVGLTLAATEVQQGVVHGLKGKLGLTAPARIAYQKLVESRRQLAFAQYGPRPTKGAGRTKAEQAASLQVLEKEWETSCELRLVPGDAHHGAWVAARRGFVMELRAIGQTDLLDESAPAATDEAKEVMLKDLLDSLPDAFHLERHREF